MESLKPFDFVALGVGGQVSRKTRQEVVEPEEIMYPEAVLKIKEEQAFQQGMNEGTLKGIEQGKSELFHLEEQTKATLEQLTTQLGAIHENMKQDHSRLFNELTDFALAVAKKIAGEALKEQPTETIMGVIKKAETLIAYQASVLLIVHPDVQEKLKETIKPFADSHPDLSLHFTTDETLQPGDIIIRWPHGEIEKSLEKQLGQIQTIMKEMFGESLPEKAPEEIVAQPVETSEATTETATAEEPENTEEVKAETTEDNTNETGNS